MLSPARETPAARVKQPRRVQAAVSYSFNTARLQRLRSDLRKWMSMKLVLAISALARIEVQQRAKFYLQCTVKENNLHPSWRKMARAEYAHTLPSLGFRGWNFVLRHADNNEPLETSAPRNPIGWRKNQERRRNSRDAKPRPEGRFGSDRKSVCGLRQETLNESAVDNKRLRIKTAKIFS